MRATMENTTGPGSYTTVQRLEHAATKLLQAQVALVAADLSLSLPATDDVFTKWERDSLSGRVRDVGLLVNGLGDDMLARATEISGG